MQYKSRQATSLANVPGHQQRGPDDDEHRCRDGRYPKVADPIRRDARHQRAGDAAGRRGRRQRVDLHDRVHGRAVRLEVQREGRAAGQGAEIQERPDQHKGVEVPAPEDAREDAAGEFQAGWCCVAL